MAKTKKVLSKRPSSLEKDSFYLLKIVLFLVLGSQWLYIINESGSSQIPIPLGAIFGIYFALHERLQVDRKIAYLTLVLAMFIGFWLPIGINLKY